tara:strand:- start:147876 stop:148799 length:924 start_codon:yes stop_codon:yes gene_type:complete
MKEVKIFTPATVANVGCGYDILGFCLDSVGDDMLIRKVDKKGIFITQIDGFELPYEVEKNVAGVSALALYNTLNLDFGFEIEISKKIKPGSGIGSSAASAVGSVFGINHLIGNPYSKNELIKFALKGEAIASGEEHADNIAPAIMGGFTLVRSTNPVDIISLPFPENLYATILHPQIEIKTSDSRSLVPSKISLTDVILQLSSVGSFIHALHTSNYDLLGKSIKDLIAEPKRMKLIPYYENLKDITIKSGSLGTSISGSGPSIFSLTKGIDTANEIQNQLRFFMDKTNISFTTYVSKINSIGVKVIS